MAGPCSCWSLCQNPPPLGKNQLAGAPPTNDTKTPTPIPAVSPTPALAWPFSPARTIVDLTVKYSEPDLKRILGNVLVAGSLALACQVLVFSDSPYKRFLKARFPKLYQAMTYIECYNFIQQYEDYFAINKAKWPNCVPFVPIFLWEQALFQWQQHKT